MPTSRALASLTVALSLFGCSPEAPSTGVAAIDSDEPNLSLKACIDGTVSGCKECVSGVWVSTCGSGYACSGSTCVKVNPVGSSCTTSVGCTSGFCVNLICCTVSACPGGCNFCVSGSGTCQIKTGVTPDGECTLSPKGAPCGAQCSGTANCAFPASGTGSCSSSSCVGTKASGFSWVTGSSTCNGTGGCKTPTTAGTDCGNYLCSGGCKTACASSAECIDSAYCSGGACLNKVGKGVECPTADSCAATAGTCAPAADGKQRCCLVSCASPQACSIDGTKCVGTTPFGGACTSDDQCATGMCSGSKCVSCKADTDCTPADYCDTTAGKCNIRAGIGNTCASAATCPSGAFCTDGVCCVVASCGVGGTCAGTKKGQCAKSNGSTCSGDFDCDSGHCVDKVCCDSLCAGQCEACSVDGSIGKCVAVKGAPVGMRPSCDAGTSSNPCSKASCDGKDREKCAALAGSEVECRATSCAAGEAVTRATCDGTGSCPEPVKASCGAYQCAAPDGTCRTSCTTTDECAMGNICRNSQCEPRTSECTDSTTSTSREGVPRACAPFRCDTSSGNCFDTCSTSEQCATGNLCSDGQCVAAPQVGGGSDDGGCSTSTPGESSSGLWLLAGLALATAVRRQRARSC